MVHIDDLPDEVLAMIFTAIGELWTIRYHPDGTQSCLQQWFFADVRGLLRVCRHWKNMLDGMMQISFDELQQFRIITRSTHRCDRFGKTLVRRDGW